MDPILYHTHHQTYKEDLAFWQTLADEQNGAVLELGCGTGRVILALQQPGTQIYGLDLDHKMLVMLKKEDSEAQVFQADMTRFHLKKQFGLIFLACNTWTTLPAQQRGAALAGIFRHLSTGGTFAVSMPNPESMLGLEDSQEIDPETTFTHPQTGNPVQVSSEWEIEQLAPNRRAVTFMWHYDHLKPDGQVQRTTHQARHWVSPAQTYLNEFQQQGFKISVLGDFDHTPYSNETSPYLIIIGEKI